MNCPKHVEFHSKNKFEKLVHLVGFIIRNTFLTVLHYLLHILHRVPNGHYVPHTRLTLATIINENLALLGC